MFGGRIRFRALQLACAKLLKTRIVDQCFEGRIRLDRLDTGRAARYPLCDSGNAFLDLAAIRVNPSQRAQRRRAPSLIDLR